MFRNFTPENTTYSMKREVYESQKPFAGEKKPSMLRQGQLQENGFTDLAKPGGQRMEACASGQLLLLAPWQHHNERTAIRRVQCLELNEMARRICEND